MNGNRIGMVVLGVAAAFAVALAARFLLVEPRNAQLVCSALDAPGWCPLRRVLVPVFTFQGFGILSLLAGGYAVLRWNGAAGVAALVLGAIGMVLYNVEFASAGAILGLIALTREPRAA